MMISNCFASCPSRVAFLRVPLLALAASACTAFTPHPTIERGDAGDADDQRELSLGGRSIPDRPPSLMRGLALLSSVPVASSSSGSVAGPWRRWRLEVDREVSPGGKMGGRARKSAAYGRHKGGEPSQAALRAAHDALFDSYRLVLAGQLASATKAGQSLSDCVALVVRTDGDPDFVAIASRADALTVARVAGLDRELMKAPPPLHLHVLTFALCTGRVRIVPVQLVALGGEA